MNCWMSFLASVIFMNCHKGKTAEPPKAPSLSKIQDRAGVPKITLKRICDRAAEAALILRTSESLQQNKYKKYFYVNA